MYCKNCGSILQQNANFCHVCGAKVEIEDLFDAPKKDDVEERVEEKVPFEDSYFKREEPKVVNSKSFYNYEPTEEERSAMQAQMARKRAFIPGLISMIGTVFLGIDAFLAYASSVLINNYYLEYGSITYDEYVFEIKNMLVSVGIYLLLGAAVGIILGAIGLKLSKPIKSAKGIVFSTVGLSIGVLLLLLISVVVIFYVKLGA